MYSKSDAELTKMGSIITTREIQQQPELWQETWAIYQEHLSEIKDFFNRINEKFGKTRVIFTGAGTSAFVGNTITPYLNEHGDRSKFDFEAIDTTKIVSTPLNYLKADQPTILVSFARSGNSPESVATVEIAEKVIENLFQVTITCAPDGKLAKKAETEEDNLLLLMPARSNDKGFAMTGSFSCMSLTSLLVFDTATDEDKHTYVNTISELGKTVVAREDEIQKIVDLDFDRIAYLGSGALGGLTQEAALKILELTAGKVATIFDTSMGFRHGPKSFLDDKTIVFDFVSNEKYTRQYDVDILEEIKADEIVPSVMSVGMSQDNDFSGDKFTFATSDLPDGYLALADVMFAQTISLMTSIKVNNTPDTPSATGTVNRVVKGVTIHEY